MWRGRKGGEAAPAELQRGFRELWLQPGERSKAKGFSNLTFRGSDLLQPGKEGNLECREGVSTSRLIPRDGGFKSHTGKSFFQVNPPRRAPAPKLCRTFLEKGWNSGESHRLHPAPHPRWFRVVVPELCPVTGKLCQLFSKQSRSLQENSFCGVSYKFSSNLPYHHPLVIQ